MHFRGTSHLNKHRQALIKKQTKKKNNKPPTKNTNKPQANKTCGVLRIKSCWVLIKTAYPQENGSACMFNLALSPAFLFSSKLLFQ